MSSTIIDMTTWRAPGESAFVPAWTMPDRLRKAREHAGLDQRTLAADIEVAVRTIGNYELGHVAPRRVVLRQWALRCGVSYEWLSTGQASSDGPDNGPTVSEGRTFNPWVVGSSPTGPTRPLAPVVDLGERRERAA